MRIILGNIFGVCYSIIFSVCLVSVQNTDTILFTLSFEDTKPLSTRDLETSEGVRQKSKRLVPPLSTPPFSVTSCNHYNKLVGVGYI